ncbi:MAG: hypothetical protein ACLQVL_00170 [Terriglobia bacterium]
MRGYQPVLAVWAETGLLLADQFRDGNVPAQMQLLTVAQQAFAALPGNRRTGFADPETQSGCLLAPSSLYTTAARVCGD